jgi:predicted ATPase/DNA-binding CsgD family transcriptional regulator
VTVAIAPWGAPSGAPSGPTPLGRDELLSTIVAVLDGPGLLTLVGPPGVGKTALARAVRGLPGGAPASRRWSVPLAEVSEDLLTATLTAAVCPGRPARSDRGPLREGLGAGRGLLVLDGAEHLHTAVADLVADLLANAPDLSVLVTSQQRLGLDGEQVAWVPPLPVPDATSARELSSVPSVALFVARAQAADASFDLAGSTSGAVSRICRLLDGLPLALELAAAQLDTMPVEELEARLLGGSGGLDLAPRDSSPRTLRQALDRSHALLPPDAAVLFRRLSVFCGGWGLGDLPEVCGGEGLSGPEVLAAHEQLEARSLVQRLGADGPRFRMLGPLRAYASEQLQRSKERERIEGHLLAHVAALVARELPGRAWTRPPDLDAIARLRAEDDNLLAALGHAERAGEVGTALRLVGGLWTYWRVRGESSIPRGILERLLPRAEEVEPEVRAGALLASASFAQTAGDYDLAERRAGEALVTCRELGDTFGQGTALSLLANVAGGRGDHPRAIRLYTEALELARRLGEPYGEALVSANLGLALASQGDADEARRALESALALLVASGDRWFRPYVLSCLARLARVDGDLERVHDLAAESAELLVAHGRSPELAEALELLASLAAEAGDVGRAIRWYATAEQLRVDIGAPLSPPDRERCDEELRALRRHAGEEAFARAWRRGTRSSLAEEVASARTFRPSLAAGSPTGDTAPLTQREYEVALRVAAGRTNKQVGLDLHISAGTARTHVQHAMRKLGFHSRSELAAWVTRRDRER